MSLALLQSTIGNFYKMPSASQPMRRLTAARAPRAAMRPPRHRAWL